MHKKRRICCEMIFQYCDFLDKERCRMHFASIKGSCRMMFPWLVYFYSIWNTMCFTIEIITILVTFSPSCFYMPPYFSDYDMKLGRLVLHLSISTTVVQLDSSSKPLLSCFFLYFNLIKFVQLHFSKCIWNGK